MNLTKTLLLASMSVGAATNAALAAEEEEEAPGKKALEQFRYGYSERNPVLNRYFLKAKRFELTPLIGIVPNNPFARRFTVSLGFGYHFSEQLAISGMFSFAPDLGNRDVKSLTNVLLQRATDDEFRQPLDKITLSAALGVNWAPLYGKINLLGEIVVNFDFHIFLGVGFAIQNEYAAVEDTTTGAALGAITLENGDTEFRAAPTVGLGANFFITQTVALQLDGRIAIIPDDRPVYDETEQPDGLRAITPFTASVGVAFFFPKMKPRLFDF
jgi:outer membrane beta-barrel protein